MAPCFEKQGRGLIPGSVADDRRGRYLLDFAHAWAEEVVILSSGLTARSAWLREGYARLDFAGGIEGLKADWVFGAGVRDLLVADRIRARIIPVDAGEVPNGGGGKNDADPGPLRVSIIGPESTGKSELARDLARLYDTFYVPEYARSFVDFHRGVCTEEDADLIARGQIASEEAMAKQTGRLLFCDTDPLLTEIFCDMLYGRCEEWIRGETRRRPYDLTLLLDCDVPWIPDSQRCLVTQADRQEFFDRCESAIAEQGRRHEIIRGDWTTRLERARAAVDRLLNAQGVQLE